MPRICLPFTDDFRVIYPTMPKESSSWWAKSEKRNDGEETMDVPCRELFVKFLTDVSRIAHAADLINIGQIKDPPRLCRIVIRTSRRMTAAEASRETTSSSSSRRDEFIFRLCAPVSFDSSGSRRSAEFFPFDGEWFPRTWPMNLSG